MDEKEQEKNVAEIKDLMTETEKIIKALGIIQNIFGITCLCIVIYDLAFIVWVLISLLK